jgi:hypothetical protein
MSKQMQKVKKNEYNIYVYTYYPKKKSQNKFNSYMYNNDTQFIFVISIYTNI